MAGILKAIEPPREGGPGGPGRPADAAGRRRGRRRRASRRRSREEEPPPAIGTDKIDPVVYKSARNLDGVVRPAEDSNTYEVSGPAAWC